MLSISISSISDQVVSVSSRKYNVLVARCGQQQARTEKSAVNDGHLHCCVKHGSLSRFDVRGTVLLSTLFFSLLGTVATHITNYKRMSLAQAASRL